MSNAETIIIAAGFGKRANGTGGVRKDHEGFAAEDLAATVRHAGAEIVARIVGTSDGGEWEPEPGIWVAATISDDQDRGTVLRSLRRNLAGWCEIYGQDAVAITVQGETNFVYEG